MFSRFTNQPHVESQIVDGRDLLAQVFVGGKQMAQIRFRIFKVDKRMAHFIERRKIGFPFFIFDVDRAVCGKQHAVSGVSGRHHAIEHVDAERDVF